MDSGVKVQKLWAGVVLVVFVTGLGNEARRASESGFERSAREKILLCLDLGVDL